MMDLETLKRENERVVSGLPPSWRTSRYDSEIAGLRAQIRELQKECNRLKNMAIMDPAVHAASSEKHDAPAD